MRLVGIALLGALLSAGCAMQAGDPTVDETQRPGELTGEPGTGQTGIAHPEDALPVDLASAPSPTSTGAKAARGGAETNPAAGTSSGGPSKDNPNPSPWGGGDLAGQGLQGPAGK